VNIHRGKSSISDATSVLSVNRINSFRETPDAPPLSFLLFTIRLIYHAGTPVCTCVLCISYRGGGLVAFSLLDRTEETRRRSASPRSVFARRVHERAQSRHAAPLQSARLQPIISSGRGRDGPAASVITGRDAAVSTYVLYYVRVFRETRRGR